MLKHKEPVYEGEPIPDLNEPKYAEFLLHLEKSVLYALKDRNLLTRSQMEQCIRETERLHTRDCCRHRA